MHGLLFAALLALVYPQSTWQQSPQRPQYFDAHNHITGILPYSAYADLPAFLRSLTGDSPGVTNADRLALYRYLSQTWYPSEGAKLGDRLFSPSDGQRFALGGRAALVVYKNDVAGNSTVLDGALERVLTATPWTEFDSAYAFRGAPAAQYLRERFYKGNHAAFFSDFCQATVLELGLTGIAISEQSLPFIGGWDFSNGKSERLNMIQCVQREQSDPAVARALANRGRAVPIVKIVLMTHTSQLATLPGGQSYAEWSKTGRCAPAPLVPAAETSADAIRQALLGRDADGKPIVAASAVTAYYDEVVGIDTAGPETTCFSPEGMTYFRGLADAVYEAAKARRAAGWHGKLLVHTHVGEGGTLDFAPNPPPQPWSAASVFGKLPSKLTNSDQATANIETLLAAIAQFQRDRPDASQYVVFRLAHATWATPEQARAMHDRAVEADVNLESNVATGAYPISRMPLGRPLLMRHWIDPDLAQSAASFKLNDLLAALVSDPANVRQVGGILGNASLKYLLEARVRCLLGTDAAGVEHSSIAKEYAYARSLIAYWKATDPQFSALASDVDETTLFNDVGWHLKNMSIDEALPY